MKKIVRQQNYLKELIESQDNHFLSRSALLCLIRSAVEPLLDNPEAGVILHRIINKENLVGLLKRIDFSSIESHSFTDNSNNLIEKVWANTEFLCVLTHRFVIILIWDNNTGDKNSVRYYSIYNSKLQHEALDIIKRNSKIDISQYQEKFNPDRRDNILLNASIRRLLDEIDDFATDEVLGYAEKSVETLIDSDFIQKKSRVVAHEIKNQLSICDLYTEIIYRYIESGNYEGIKNSLKSINKALKMMNNSLISLKLKEETILESISLNSIIESAIELSQVYLKDKNIELQIEIQEDIVVNVDNDKLLAVLINLIKNAVEAFSQDTYGVLENSKYIKIKTEKEDNVVKIFISNNALGISDPDKIFNEGYTTKVGGSGLGLWICKKFIEQLCGDLELSRSSEDYTEFTIKLGG